MKWTQLCNISDFYLAKSSIFLGLDLWIHPVWEISVTFKEFSSEQKDMQTHHFKDELKDFAKKLEHHLIKHLEMHHFKEKNGIFLNNSFFEL